MNNFNYLYNKNPLDLSFPSFKNENWRYINLRDLKKELNKFESIKEKYLTLNNQDIDVHIMINNEAIHLNKKLPNGISVSIIDPDKIDLIDSNIKNKIGRIAKIDDYFVLENTKAFNQLVFIEIDGQSDSILNIDINLSKDANLKNRYFIYSKEHSVSTLQINFHNSCSFVNSVFEFCLEDESDINLTCLNNGKESVEVVNYWFEVNKKANLNATFISLGSEKILKNDIRVDLVGKNAKADIGGLYIPKPNSVVDYNLKINHLSKKTLSNQFFRGILEEYSRASFTGLVKIEKGCTGSKSQQVNNNLLLSDKAHVKSDPQLEIYCDEVECSHGSTVGQFDDDIIFYLCSRGIPKKYAQRMLLEAFYIDILNRINVPKIQSIVETNLA